MELYKLLTLLGVPALATLIIRKGADAIRRAAARRRALEAGVQALLRAQLIADYNRYSALGYAPVYARESFENCWLRYEALGANGVLRDIRERFMALPQQPEPSAAATTERGSDHAGD